MAASDMTFTISVTSGEVTTVPCGQGEAAYVGTATYYKKNGSEIGTLPLVRDEQQVNIGRFGPAPKKSPLPG